MITFFSFSAKEHTIQKFYFISLLLIAVSLFSPNQFHNNLAIMLLALTWTIEGAFSRKYRKLKANPVIITYLILFLLYLVGVFYTEDIRAGFKHLETKAPLLIFPVLLGTSSIQRTYLNKVLLAFAILCIVCSLVALVYQTNIVLVKNDFNYFFSDGLVSIMKKKAVYYALYVSFSILILINYLRVNFTAMSWKYRAVILSGIMFLLLILFLLATRTSLMVLLLILITTLIVSGIRYKKFKYMAYLIVVLFIFLAALSAIFPQTVSRFKSLRHISYNFSDNEDVYHFSGGDNYTKWNGLNLRLAKWVCAVDVIKDHALTGVGTGDVKNEMVKAYEKRNFIYAAVHRYDPHNQYIDTTVGVGIGGLIMLLCCYLYPLYLAFRNRDWLFFSFMVLIMLCSLTESVLSSAQGITFICFFIFLLLNNVSAPEADNKI